MTQIGMSSKSTSRAQVRYLLVLALSGAGVAGWVLGHTERTPFDLVYLVGLTLSFTIGRVLSIQLPQGDRVQVTLMVGLVGLLLRGIDELLLALVVACMIDGVYRFLQGGAHAARQGAFDSIRSIAVLGLMSFVRSYVNPASVQALESDGPLLAVLVVGVVFVAVDVLTLAVQQWLAGGAPVAEGIVLLLRPLGSVYMVHIAMGAVAIRVHPSLGSWGLGTALLLTLILQNSFNLYLRIRRGYTQTIEALAHAAELDRPDDTGHARRVADLAVSVGRQVGLTSDELEKVGYAALLHDIGRIGYEQPEADVEHPDRGAEIVAGIPFLEGVGPLIRQHRNTGEGDAPRGAMVVGVCCRYDRLRKTHGARAALDILSADEQGYRRSVVDVVERTVVKDGGRLVTAKSVS
ncbi:MAG: HD domain-containing protein [Coriobacteriia bacterium]|nr:HD domain-containing protein [Coriobacteriia bacterium]